VVLRSVRREGGSDDIVWTLRVSVSIENDDRWEFSEVKWLELADFQWGLNGSKRMRCKLELVYEKMKVHIWDVV
jgi:hypothetical protein